ncbi:MAG: hypothetical protein P4L40_01995, partial [Terracidiphilus sp.]|nr:hypothetical protein [Terracidiphilus sp.]
AQRARQTCVLTPIPPMLLLVCVYHSTIPACAQTEDVDVIPVVEENAEESAVSTLQRSAKKRKNADAEVSDHELFCVCSIFAFRVAVCV